MKFVGVVHVYMYDILVYLSGKLTFIELAPKTMLNATDDGYLVILKSIQPALIQLNDG